MTKKRIVAILMVVLVAFAMMPINSFALESVSVTVIGKNAVTEGNIHKETDAKLTATAEENFSFAGTKTYTWYEVDLNGNKLDEDPLEVDALQANILTIPEDLTAGAHYFVCVVEYYDIDSNLVGRGTSNPFAVTVAAGTPVVILDPNGGSFPEIFNPSNPYDVNIGTDKKLSASDLPGTPAKEGMKFIGWYTEKDFGGVKVDLSTATFDHTTRLYAKYDTFYTATFKANGGKFEYDLTEYFVEFNEGVILKESMPKDPVRDGYVFAGWYRTNDDGEEIKLQFIGDLGIAYAKMSDHEYLAKWEKVGGGVTNPPAKDTPKTGDSGLVPWAVLAACALMTTTAIYRKNNKA